MKQGSVEVSLNGVFTHIIKQLVLQIYDEEGACSYNNA